MMHENHTKLKFWYSQKKILLEPSQGLKLASAAAFLAGVSEEELFQKMCWLKSQE